MYIKNEPIFTQKLAHFYYVDILQYTTNWRGDFLAQLRTKIFVAGTWTRFVLNFHGPQIAGEVCCVEGVAVNNEVAQDG